MDRRLEFLSPEEAVVAARADIYKGETTAAVRLLVGAFVEVFNESCGDMQEEVVEVVLSEWPADRGAGIKLVGRSALPVFGKDRFNAVEAVVYYRFVRKFVVDVKAVEHRSGSGSLRRFVTKNIAWRTKAHVSALAGTAERVTRYLIRCLPDRINKKVQWYLISLLVEIGFGCAHISTSRLRMKESVRSISVYLREPQRNARRILKCSHKWRGVVHLNDRRSPRRIRSVEALVNSFCWNNERDYRSFARRDSSSRIIVSAHMGFARAASIRMSRHSMPGSEVINIVQERSNKADLEVAEALYAVEDIRFRELEAKDLNVMELISLLRNGRTIVHMMFDLSQFFGRTVKVNFLGQDAQFSRGPAELAVIGRVPVYPGFAYFDGDRQRLKLCQPVPCMRGKYESRKDAVHRITQAMVKELESIIRVYPEQWQFVAEVNKYFTGKGGAAIQL